MRIIFGFLILVTLALGAYFLSQEKRKPNVIVITIDTLRADHLSVYGYERKTSPNLEEFAKDSAVFSRAFSTASWTPPGTTSILSGLYPTAHTNQPPKRLTTALQTGIKLPAELRLLPEILKENGYQSSALSSNPWITEEFGFDRGFDRFYYSKHLDAKGILDRSRKSVERFLQSADQSFFMYLHLIDPHAPYTSHPQHQFSGELSRRKYSETALADINAYDSEIAFTDYHLGKFFEYLKANDLYDNSIIVVTADHGEAFDEHGITGHGFHLHVEEVHIPLIFKGLGKTGRFDNSVSQVDILPSILDILKLPQPYALAGISLRKTEEIGKRTGVYSENYRIYRQRAFSSVDGERLIMEMGDIENPKDQMSKKGLYALAQDPLEQSNLEDQELETELKSYLDQTIAANKPLSATREVDLASETLQQLETLGYIN
jgi:arylsulfatase A-like enzyme